MNKDAIVREIVRLSNKEPNLYIIEAIQLLNSALILVDSDKTLSAFLYAKAKQLSNKGLASNVTRQDNQDS